MKKQFTYLLIIAIIAMPVASFAKGKKDKEKKMSKKDMQAALTSLNGNVTDLNQKIADLEAAKADLQSKLDQANADADKAKQDLAAAQEAATTAKTEADKAKAGMIAPSGLAFKVQIGAYKSFNISTYFEKPKSINTEDVDGMNKYIIGYFNDLDKATAFQKDVKKMGIKDAWIVPYKDGARISDDEAEQLLGRPFRDKSAKKGKK